MRISIVVQHRRSSKVCTLFPDGQKGGGGGGREKAASLGDAMAQMMMMWHFCPCFS